VLKTVPAGGIKIAQFTYLGKIYVKDQKTYKIKPYQL